MPLTVTEPGRFKRRYSVSSSAIAPPSECPTYNNHVQSGLNNKSKRRWADSHYRCGTLCADQLVDFGEDGRGGSAMRVSESTMHQDVARDSGE